MMKIYVRERLNVGKGENQPRFRVIAVAGEALHLYAGHLRKTELEQIAKRRRGRHRLLGPSVWGRDKEGGGIPVVPVAERTW